MNDSKFDYWQLKELDERYAPKDKSGCFSIIVGLLTLGLVNFVVITTITRIWRLEKNAGIELTWQQIIGIDKDPILEKLNKKTTP